MTRMILNTGIQWTKSSIFEDELSKYPLRKTLRIGARETQFINYFRCKRDNKKYGPLKAEEIGKQRFWWIMTVQTKAKEISS